jgi:hypothetical protein
VIAAFWYLWETNHWYDLAAEQLFTLSRAGFPGKIRLHLGGSSEWAAREVQALAGACGLQLEVAWDRRGRDEYPAVSALKAFCDQTPGDHKVLYFHGKNITLKGVCGTKWRWAMTQAVIVNWRNRLDDLRTHDVCGFCLKDDPSYRWIFAGNFWWATSRWIRSLPTPLPDQDRFHYEQWLLSRDGFKAKSLVSEGGSPHLEEFYVRHGNPQDRFLRFMAGKD